MPTEIRQKTRQITNLYRDIKIDEKSIDVENRTVKLSWSSEAPVPRWFGDEILDHGPDSNIRLDRLRDGGPLLVDHDARDENHIGVIQSVSIDDDRVGRAVVRFAEDERSEKIFQKVITGVKRKVSFMYQVHRYIVDEEKDTHTAIDWEPFEISFVSVPADNTVGVGRAAETNTTQTTFEYRSKKTMRDNNPTQEITQVDVETAVNAEQSRTSTILELGAKYHHPKLAAQYAKDPSKTADQFKDALMEEISTGQPTPSRRGDMPGDLDLSPNDLRNYSIMRAIRAAASKDWSKAGFELECSQAIQDRANKDPRGFFVPLDVLGASARSGEAMGVTTDGSGDTGVVGNAGLVGTTHAADRFVEALRERAVVLRAGAIMLPGLVGNVDIPKQTSVSEFVWIDENDSSPPTKFDTGTIPLRYKTMSGSIPMTRKLLKQSSPAVEQLVRNDLIRGAALGIDKAALQGAGGDTEPMGIIPAIAAVSGFALANFDTWANITAMWAKIAGANADLGTLKYIIDADAAGVLMSTLKHVVTAESGGNVATAAAAGFIMEDMRINNYETLVTNTVKRASTKSTLLFGDFSQLIIAMWGVLDINVDTATLADKGGLVLRAFQDADMGIRHIESFTYNGPA